MSHTAPEHPPLAGSYRRVKRLILRTGIWMGLVVYLGVTIWLIEEAVVAGARLLDEATWGAVSKAVGKVFEFMKDRLLPSHPAR